MPPDVKRVFVQAVKKGRQYMVTTSELNGLNVRLLDATSDALTLSNMVLDGCTATVRDALPALSAFSEAVSLLDMVVNAFAMTVSGSERKYVRPQLTLDGPVAIQNGRHPVACAQMHAEGRVFVANSTFLTDASSFGAHAALLGGSAWPARSRVGICAVVLTGCNMSGKSTYLKQVALNAVLAHTGCYVAAEFASFRLLDRICSRLGSGDDTAANASTFLLECRDLAHILRSATSRSLCIIDELGRATSTSDGFALAFAASEHLLATGAFTICATHMERLCELGALYAGSRHCHLRVVALNDRLQFVHELTEVRTRRALPCQAERPLCHLTAVAAARLHRGPTASARTTAFCWRAAWVCLQQCCSARMQWFPRWSASRCGAACAWACRRGCDPA